MEDKEYEDYLEQEDKKIREIEDIIAPFMNYYKREGWKIKGGIHNYWWHSADSKIWGKGTWTPAFEIGGSQFHDSWDWIMPAFEKAYGEVNEFVSSRNFMRDDLLSFDIDKVLDATITAIKIINERKSD